MCKSVRGAAFFGASLHTAFALVFLLWFLFDTVISEIGINLWQCEQPIQQTYTKEHHFVAHYLNLLFKLVYFITLLITGIYMFRGVERVKPRVLKFATLVFIVLQITGLVLFVVFSIILRMKSSESGNSSNDELSPVTARLMMENGADDSSTLFSDEFFKSEERINSMEIQNIEPNSSEAVGIPMELPKVQESKEILTRKDITELFRQLSQLERPPVTHMESNKVVPLDSQKLRARNDFVAFVFQMCLVVFNAVGTVIYVTVVFLYMMGL